VSKIDADWPAYTDDTGAGNDGTIGDSAWFDLMREAVNTQVYTAAYPTLKPKDTMEEVAAARGALASLAARLTVSLNDDGTLKTQASLITATDAASFIGKRSFAKNDEFGVWGLGAAAAPTSFTLSGTGAAVARCGAGESDTQTLDAGTYCAKVTYGSAEAKLTQSILSAAEVSKWGRVKGKKVVIGIRCKASVPNQASFIVDDGVTTTRGGQAGAGTYHTGGGSAEWLYAIHTISNSATKLDVYCSVASSGAAYFGGLVVVFSDTALLDWMPNMAQSTRYPEIVMSGWSGAQGYGVFRTTNAAKKTLTIPIGVLAGDGEAIRVRATGAETGANFHGLGMWVVHGGGTADYYTQNGSAAVGPGQCDFTIVRVSATSIQVQGHTSENMAQGATSPLTVSDLGTTDLVIGVGCHSNAGSGTASMLHHYSVEKIPVVV